MRQPHAVRWQAVLLLRGHLAEGARVAIGEEDRIIAEARGPPGWPDQRAVNPRLDLFYVAVRPGDAQRGDEMRAALAGLARAALLQQPLDTCHGAVKVLRRTRPARRMD